MYILCVRVKINKRSFEPFCVWMMDTEQIVRMTAARQVVEEAFPDVFDRKGRLEMCL